MTRKSPARRLVPGLERDRVAAELRTRYEAGASIRALAEEAGRSYGGVHRLLVVCVVSFSGVDHVAGAAEDSSG
ncbi:helix-turn-helix domain-containing protein [Streptomyces sp. NPDC058572]|uniref:helix-turn-helix domain-containing protein n=1 Tax=Streptomyces sp. NPDC058572 TaxID=3346546 RepID=UPI00365BCA6A